MVQPICYAIHAGPWDADAECFSPSSKLEGVCLREQVPDGTTGTGELGCLIAPNGAVYVAFVGYTTVLEGEGWSGEGAEALPIYEATTPACIAALGASWADVHPSCAAMDGGS